MDEHLSETSQTLHARFFKIVKDVGHSVMTKLSTMDLNPHEGRLRSSIAPVEYMGIPDFVPIHDDNILND